MFQLTPLRGELGDWAGGGAGADDGGNAGTVGAGGIADEGTGTGIADVTPDDKAGGIGGAGPGAEEGNVGCTGSREGERAVDGAGADDGDGVSKASARIPLMVGLISAFLSAIVCLCHEQAGVTVLTTLVTTTLGTTLRIVRNT